MMSVILAFPLTGLRAQNSLQSQNSDPAEQTEDSLLQLGAESLKSGQYKEAEQAFGTVLKRDPGNTNAITGIIQAYRAQTKYDEAIRLLQSEIEKEPARLDYHLAVGDIAMKTNSYDLALREFLGVLNHVNKLSPGAGDLYFRIGEVYFRKGELDFAIIFLRQARELLPRNSLVLATLAAALDRAGHKQEADLTYRWAVNADAKNAPALNNLAFLMAENGGDLDVALGYAEHARKLYPKLASAADTLGWVYLKKNRIDEAISLFREVVKQNPAEPAYHYHLAVALYGKGDHAAAAKELDAALKSNPSKQDEQKIKDLLAKIGK